MIRITPQEVKRLRQSRGYTKDEMAQVIGTTTKGYAKRERGDKPFTDRQMVELHKTFANGLWSWPFQLLTHCGERLTFQLRDKEIVFKCGVCKRYVIIDLPMAEALQQQMEIAANG